MFIAISFHKWVEALSIGINLNKTMIQKEVLIMLITIFSMTTPLGILCGLILRGISKIFEAIFLSISAGTFLYIAASEVIIEEFSVSQFKNQKFFGFVAGAVIISIFTIVEFYS
jgi:solute carrier family 39 (zinc transporter), member 1/2/3